LTAVLYVIIEPSLLVLASLALRWGSPVAGLQHVLQLAVLPLEVPAAAAEDGGGGALPRVLVGVLEPGQRPPASASERESEIKVSEILSC
jgi:hypothetical protein